MKEQRKHWLMGLSPGNWITILTLVVGLSAWGLGTTISYAKAMDQIDDNTKAIKDDRQEAKQEREKTAAEIKQDIANSEARTRSDIRELRSLILQQNRDRK